MSYYCCRYVIEGLGFCHLTGLFINDICLMVLCHHTSFSIVNGQFILDWRTHVSVGGGGRGGDRKNVGNVVKWSEQEMNLWTHPQVMTVKKRGAEQRTGLPMLQTAQSLHNFQPMATEKENKLRTLTHSGIKSPKSSSARLLPCLNEQMTWMMITLMLLRLLSEPVSALVNHDLKSNKPRDHCNYY